MSIFLLFQEKENRGDQSFYQQHLIYIDQTRILASTMFHSFQIIHEVLEIEKKSNNFNHDDGYKLS